MSSVSWNIDFKNLSDNDKLEALNILNNVLDRYTKLSDVNKIKIIEDVVKAVNKYENAEIKEKEIALCKTCKHLYGKCK